MKLENIANIKNVSNIMDPLMMPHKIICDKIIDSIIKIDELKFLKFRDLLYDIFIYNLDISDCIWYILSFLIKENKIKREDISDILIKTYHFFQYYNNNYRPIYHVENYFLFLAKRINNF
jgi:hypothetical protein